MDYQKIYNNIIQNAQKLNRKKGKGILFEKHHILPKSLGGSNSKHNLVLLTPKEHYISHRLLVEIYKETPYENKMYYAMWCMINGLGNQKRYAVSSRIYNNFRIHMHKLQSKERYDNRKQIEQYSLEGEYLNVFDSAKSAASYLKINRSSIENCARGESKTAGGFNWKYSNTDKQVSKVIWEKAGVKKGTVSSNKGKKIPAGTRNRQYKKVIQYTLDSDIIKKWESIHEASLETNIKRASIENCARGESKTAGGYIWKYTSITSRLC
jgi:hypothetical protein